jgi:subtilisin family serine protease
LVVPGVVAVQESERAPRGDILPAPGRDVLSLTPDGHYDFASGSSFAAAQISGALALMRAGAPRASLPQLLAALRESIESDAAHGRVVNVCKALALVQPADFCREHYNR